MERHAVARANRGELLISVQANVAARADGDVAAGLDAAVGLRSADARTCAGRPRIEDHAAARVDGDEVRQCRRGRRSGGADAYAIARQRAAGEDQVPVQDQREVRARRGSTAAAQAADAHARQAAERCVRGKGHVAGGVDELIGTQDRGNAVVAAQRRVGKREIARFDALRARRVERRDDGVVAVLHLARAAGQGDIRPAYNGLVAAGVDGRGA